jgi:hypothetical protein
MRNRNLWGLAALLLLVAAVFGGSLLCQPAAERAAIPPEADEWREQPAAARLGAEPQRSAAEMPADAQVREALVRVVDQDGAPVLGAEVFLNWADKPGAAPAARAFADLDGRVSFRDLPHARFRVHAMAAGFFPSARHEELAIPAAVRPEILLPLERGGLISGFVFGLDGFEVPFAWLRLRDLDTGEKLLTRADERGAFESGALRRGAWEIAWLEHEQADADPRLVWSALVEPGRRIEVIVTLDKTTRGEPRAGRAVGIEPFRRGG